MSAKVNQSKGRRYSPEEKQVILQYMDEINTERGRGGQRAASMHFKIAPLTITSWRTSQLPERARSEPIGRKLAELQKVHHSIAELEKNLRHWRTEFDMLKASL